MGLLCGRGASGIAGDIILQLGTLRILACLRRRQLRRTFGALPFETVIPAGIQRGLPALQMQDIIDDIVQQIAFVADHHHHRRVGFQEVFKPQGRFQIEVVRRLVEQQKVRFGKQQSRQRHPHFPTARITIQGPPLHFLVKAEAHQDARGAGRGGVSVDRNQPFVQFAQPVRVGAMLGLIHQACTLDIARQHSLERRRGAARRFLRDIADAR